MIVQSIGFSQFVDAFNYAGRKDQFTYAGKRALFDDLESVSDDTGEPYELDVIALCCEYSEFDSALEAAAEYSNLWTPDANESERDQEASAIEFLRYHTTVIDVDGGGVIIAEF